MIEMTPLPDRIVGIRRRASGVGFQQRLFDTAEQPVVAKHLAADEESAV
jgi:hypothetical protein